MSRPMVSPRNTRRWDESDVGEYGVIRSGVGGVGTATITNANAPIRCEANQVAIIDEVYMTCRINDLSTNQTCFININGRTSGELGAPSTRAADVLPFHFPGHIDFVRNEQIRLRPRGGMVVHPSSTLWVNAAAAGGQIHCDIKYRKKSLVAAIRDGDISPNGGLPMCASTNSVTGSGTVAGTAKQIIAGQFGLGIEILGIYLTGHNYNTATDDIRLGFWNGGGSFAGGQGLMLFRGYFKGVAAVWAPKVIIENTQGAIQGNSFDSLYIQATANVAGATPKADYVVMYRMVTDVEVMTPTGIVNNTPTTRKKWWLFSEADAGGIGVGETLFAVEPNNNQTIRVLGQAGSAIIADNALENVIGMNLSSGTLGASALYLINGARDAGAQSVSFTFSRSDMNIAVPYSADLKFFALEGAADTITSRCHLAWGKFSSSTKTDLIGSIAS